MHTDSTLSWLEQCTTTLGRQLRRFQSYTCSFFQTRELPKEAAARGRRKAKKKPTSNQKDKTLAVASSSSKVSKLKVFNLVTFKLHALGDYVRTIRWFGTSDSYSTQPVRCLKNMNISWQLIELKLEKGELEHRRVKKFYARTNKNAAIRQITRLERREDALRRIQRRKARESATTVKPYLTFTESEALPYTPPVLHHHISDLRNFPVNITSFLASFQGDPAISVCF